MTALHALAGTDFSDTQRVVEIMGRTVGAPLGVLCCTACWGGGHKELQQHTFVGFLCDFLRKS